MTRNDERILSDEEVKALILWKLYRMGKWGESHTAFDELKKGWKPKALGRRGLKRLDKMGRELIKEGYLRVKPKPYGLAVSLEVKRRKEILKLIEEHLPGML